MSAQYRPRHLSLIWTIFTVEYVTLDRHAMVPKELKTMQRAGHNGRPSVAVSVSLDGTRSNRLAALLSEHIIVHGEVGKVMIC